MNPTEVFLEIHSGLPREGPGDDVSTERAFRMVRGLPERPNILDVGCGPGAQTVALARLSGGRVTAVDTHAPYLEVLRSAAVEAGLADRIGTVRASMTDLPFPDASFDLIWSEGAIYIMGFENGLRAWRRLLRPGGSVAVTEISWLTADRPRDLTDFWTQAYPGIRTVDENLDLVRASGYEAAGHFVLPDESWWASYYRPLGSRLERLGEKYRNDPAALDLIDVERREIELFRKYSAYYGYVFYILDIAVAFP